ncbi:MAG: hypothetical protein GDA36_06165 [Rhodobacteraceae bacterium]|nr:hypothetical protein [Paracoccaceae bacterium]
MLQVLALSGIEYAFGFVIRYCAWVQDVFCSLAWHHDTPAGRNQRPRPQPVVREDFGYLNYVPGHGYRRFNFDRKGDGMLRLYRGKAGMAATNMSGFPAPTSFNPVP